jgi:uncharacterized protein YjbI with pentapeptide repeats
MELHSASRVRVRLPPVANPEHLAVLSEGVLAWNLWRVDLTGADLTGADLSRDPFRGTGVDLTGADLTGADLTRAKLFEANLTGANLTRANLTRATLNHANLTDAILAAATLERATLKRVTLTGAAMVEANLTGANLTRADLTDANLRRATLDSANLFEANLTGANLTHANLIRAVLHRATLANVHLIYANLTNAILGGADLTGADLNFANLFEANLTGANLTSAELDETILADLDLSKTLGLGECVHRGPSVLDYRTLLRSGNKLPVPFLRGCGLPDRLIDYLPSLLDAGPIQFYSCFISYATHNQDFANRLHADLQDRGVRCWFAPHDMQPGKKIHEQIDEAIRVYDRLLLILSDKSMGSVWVKTEIAKARQKEVTLARRVLFPLALVPFKDIRAWKQFDADLGEDTAKEIREYFIPDFSDWKDHDAYAHSFERLLKALKSED